MDIQKIGIKILSDAPVTLDLEPFLSIFSRWRTDKEDPAEWVDLADYAHMRRGPGIVLVGHGGNIAFDMGTAAPGILYVSKKGLSGPAGDRLKTVFRECLRLAKALTAEKEFPAGVHLKPGSIEIVFNDRLEAPHTEATDRELRPAVTEVLDQFYGAGKYRLVPEPNSGLRYGFLVLSDTESPLEVLSQRVQP